MNEWLNKGTDIQPASSISPSSLNPHYSQPENNLYETNSAYYAPPKNLTALAQVATYCETPSQSKGNAKKRWLRQAIIEDQCDSPCGGVRPESPQNPEMVAPPKKRKLPRESISESPPATPTNVLTPTFLTNSKSKEDISIDGMLADSESPISHEYSEVANEISTGEGSEELFTTVVSTPVTTAAENRKGKLLFILYLKFI